jgi:hypothetical protein
LVGQRADRFQELIQPNIVEPLVFDQNGEKGDLGAGFGLLIQVISHWIVECRPDRVFGSTRVD